MAELGSTAVVLGAGMAGLLAARVLSEFYESVTVVERDRLPDRPEQRRGVPQGRHLHHFLSGGTQVLGQLFPGLLDRLVAAGAVVIDGGDRSRICARIGGHQMNRTGRPADPEPLTLYQASRPFMEFHVRQHLIASGAVTIIDGCEVIEPTVVADVVTGVRIVNRDNGITTSVNADLVVDAMGRAARTPAFLEKSGFGRPPEKLAAATWGYCSQPIRIPPGRICERMVFINQGRAAPGVLLVAYEHDTWMLAVARSSDLGRPPTDFAEALAVAEQNLPGAIAAGLRDATPIGDIAIARDTAAVWRRYDRMPRFPAGLLIIGDALCSLNPLYGQGMTMACLQGLALRDCLRVGGTADLPRRFFGAAAGHIGPTWAMNAANNRAPVAGVRRTLAQRLREWTANAVMRAAARDITVAERLLRVGNLVEPPARLRDPALISRILLANLRLPRPA